MMSQILDVLLRYVVLIKYVVKRKSPSEHSFLFNLTILISYPVSFVNSQTCLRSNMVSVVFELEALMLHMQE